MITRDSFETSLEKADRTLSKRISAYLKDQNEENVHNLRTTVRRLLALVLILPKKVRNKNKVKKHFAVYEKLMRLNADTRDLDIIISKVEQRNQRQKQGNLAKELKKLRDSSLKPGLRLARSLKGHSRLPVRPKDLSDSELRDRFDKITQRYISRIEKRLPFVMEHPEEEDELHMLREDSRMLRYILDLDKGKNEDEQQAVLRSWQDVLGEIHDSDIFIQYFERAKKSPAIKSLLDAERVIRNRNYEKFLSLAKSRSIVES